MLFPYWIAWVTKAIRIIFQINRNFILFPINFLSVKIILRTSKINKERKGRKLCCIKSFSLCLLGFFSFLSENQLGQFNFLKEWGATWEWEINESRLACIFDANLCFEIFFLKRNKPLKGNKLWPWAVSVSHNFLLLPQLFGYFFCLPVYFLIKE